MLCLVARLRRGTLHQVLVQIPCDPTMVAYLTLVEQSMSSNRLCIRGLHGDMSPAHRIHSRDPTENRRKSRSYHLPERSTRDLRDPRRGHQSAPANRSNLLAHDSGGAARVGFQGVLFLFQASPSQFMPCALLSGNTQAPSSFDGKTALSVRFFPSREATPGMREVRALGQQGYGVPFTTGSPSRSVMQ